MKEYKRVPGSLTNLTRSVCLQKLTRCVQWKMLHSSRLRKGILLLVVVFVGFLYIHVSREPLFQGLALHQVSNSVHEIMLETKHEEQQQRLQQIATYCGGTSLQRDQQEYKERYKFNVLRNIYFYKKYDLSYCKVPKVGCTFMAEMFQILTSNYTHNSVKNKPRSTIHFSTWSLRTRNKTSTYPIVIASRNPYSRLYSAYVDKILLPNMYTVAKKIKLLEILRKKGKDTRMRNSNNIPICANTVTFQQFLDHVIRTAKSTHEMDLHWTPISSICQPCLADIYMVIKQETFTDDIEDFLHSLQVTKATFTDIKAIMTSKRIESTIPGIIRVVFKYGKFLRKCLSKVQLLEKLWTSFQIQGYISEGRVFPVNTFNRVADRQSMEYISNLIVNQIKESNLSKEESRSQRNRYLSRAFQDISIETIEEIKRLYKFDFLMFGYNMDPPV